MSKGLSESRRQLVTVHEAAARLCVSVRTIWRLIKDGRLTTRRIGNCTRIEIGHLNDLLDDS